MGGLYSTVSVLYLYCINHTNQLGAMLEGPGLPSVPLSQNNANGPSTPIIGEKTVNIE